MGLRNGVDSGLSKGRDGSKLFLAFTVLSLALYGCAHSLAPVQMPDSANALAEFDSLRLDMRNAKDDQVDVLAPDSFSKASDYFAKVQEDISRGADDHKTFEDIGYARAYLNLANQQSPLPRANLPDLTKAREQALRGGGGHFQADLAADDGDFKNFSKDVIAGKSVSVGDVGALQERYLALELKAIKQERLGGVSRKIEMAKKDGAEKYAPLSYALAKEHLMAAEKTVETDRHDRQRIDRAVDAADREADHCLEITGLAKNNRDKSPEQIALELDAKDSAWAQSERNAQLAEQNVNAKNEVVAEQSAELARIRQDNAEMAGIVALNEDLEHARKEFTDQEAEVYRQGNSLVIRLKGMQFGTGSHEIPKKSFDTLKKVQAVIEDLQPEKILVEGHTDDRGSSPSNLKLSEKRADAVARYFSALEGVDPNSVEHRGFGDKRPIASNKTESGRAQNRRVDIVLETDAVQE